MGFSGEGKRWYDVSGKGEKKDILYLPSVETVGGKKLAKRGNFFYCGKKIINRE